MPSFHLDKPLNREDKAILESTGLYTVESDEDEDEDEDAYDSEDDEYGNNDEYHEQQGDAEGIHLYQSCSMSTKVIPGRCCFIY